MNKYGQDKFTWEILFVCNSLAQLDLKEMEFIEKFKSQDPNLGYNLTKGGDGGNTWSKLSEKEKISAARKLSKSNKKNYRNNPERREESAKRLSAIRKDPVKSSKNRQISSERLKLLNKTDPRFLEANRKPVICLETQKIYSSIKEAALAMNVKQGTMQWYISNDKKCKGFTFKKL